MQFMKRILILALLSAIPLLGAASNGDDQGVGALMARLMREDRVLLRYDVEGHGKKRIYSALRRQIVASPNWSGKGKLPLSVGDAVARAEKHLMAADPTHTQLSLNSVGLHMIAAEKVVDRWYFALSFQSKRRVATGWKLDSLRVVMLMDGTIIPS